MRLIGLAALVVLALVAPALAGKRVALVVGNAAYTHLPALKNPGRDASEVAAALERLGFATTVLSNVGRTALNDGFKRFAQDASGADIVFVYFSGHGAEFEGRNWLMPVDAQLDTRDDFNDADLLAVDRVTSTLRDRSKVRILVLDACRDNPVVTALKRRVAEAQGSRGGGLTRGLGRTITSSGDLVVYATQSGEVAADGDGANSPFTASLLKHIETADLDVRNMFFRVQTEVATRHRQVPEVSNSIVGDEFKLKIAAAVPGTEGARPALVQPADPAERAWAAAKDTSSRAVLEEFIRRYGDSFYATLARARLDDLAKSQVTTISPPSPRPEPALPPPDPCAKAAAHWTSMRNLGTLAAFQNHLTYFRHCRFAGEARAAIESLTRGAAAVEAPPRTRSRPR